jgi:shikimate dehydrogenase
MSTGKRFILIGHPVAHSISPQIHHAAYRALGAPHHYQAVDCPDEAAVAAQVLALQNGQLGGINVTVPWKRVALRSADRRDPLAEQIGAANVLVREPDGSLTAYNTDALALVDELRADALPARAAVIGSGGAARAVVAACRALGIASVFVTARKFGAVGDDALAADFRGLGASVIGFPTDDEPARREEWRAAAVSSLLIVQATSAGMQGADSGEAVRALVPWDELDPGAFAYDVVYNPPVTPFLRAARERKLRAENGVGMLVGQAARAIELWLGSAPPRGPMSDAAEQALAEKNRRRS